MKTARRHPVTRKIYLDGRTPGVRVPMREVLLTSDDPPVRLYDTSGPYTDPAFTPDL
ncbi:MAG: hypothetical protein HYT86_07795, partial [candidate division NC10 bacterium]|nr:hypothetical protein [candidate division NC10 bacterium]